MMQYGSDPYERLQQFVDDFQKHYEYYVVGMRNEHYAGLSQSDMLSLLITVFSFSRDIAEQRSQTVAAAKPPKNPEDRIPNADDLRASRDLGQEVIQAWRDHALLILSEFIDANRLLLMAGNTIDFHYTPPPDMMIYRHLWQTQGLQVTEVIRFKGYFYQMTNDFVLQIWV